eukprot:scaffold25069_cov87-Isochrysis_galbana.AAC.3
MSDAEPAASTTAATLSFVPGEAGSTETKAVLTSAEERAAAIKRQVRGERPGREQSARADVPPPWANLAKDKFLRGEITKPDSDGWVAIKVLGTFNRMKVRPSRWLRPSRAARSPPCTSPLPSLVLQELNPSGDASDVASALAGSEAVEVSDCKTKLRRFPHLSKKSVTLGGKTFSSRAEVIGTARPLLDSEAALDADGVRFVTDLLAHHAKAAEKIGVGIQSIKPGCNPKWPDTKCFMLVRTDGTEEDFSYIKCGTAARPSCPACASHPACPGNPHPRQYLAQVRPPPPPVSHPRCVNALFPLEAEPHGRTRSSKRKADAGDAEPPSKRGPAAASQEQSYAKGTIVVVRALPEGQNVSTLKESFNVASGTPGAVKFVEVVDGQPLAYVRFSSAAGAAAAMAAKPEGVGE